MRGEYLVTAAIPYAVVGSPPLARGIRSYKIPLMAQQRITPACAGNTAGGAPDLRCNRDHPRLRGEYLFQRYNGLHSAGSPPLARGILTMLMIQDGIEGITPACAGNTLRLIRIQVRLWDHPRLRGEYPSTTQYVGVEKGSPPLARGIH